MTLATVNVNANAVKVAWLASLADAIRSITGPLPDVIQPARPKWIPADYWSANVQRELYRSGRVRDHLGAACSRVDAHAAAYAAAADAYDRRKAAEALLRAAAGLADAARICGPLVPGTTGDRLTAIALRANGEELDTLYDKKRSVPAPL